MVSIPSSGITVRDLSSRLSMKIHELRKRLSGLGEPAPLDDGIIELDIAELVVLELG